MLRKNFEIKQAGELRTLELYLYGEIEADYFDWWTGKLVESTTSANYVRKALDDAGNVDAINIYINSCGGYVSEGIAIFNILKRSTAFKTVYVDAFAYSIASVIAMCGDKIVMPSNTTMMIHNAWTCASGNSEQLRKAADDLDTINEASCNTYLAKSSKIDKENLTKLLDAETFLTAEQAFEYGFCDEIANPIDISNSVEILEQAKQKHNPAVKAAAQHLQSNAKTPASPEPKNKEPEPKNQQDKYEWLNDIMKSKKLL
jgi:ATP-dependent protease ClpP protease subunit